jgi:deoxycytidine triphosphate deaminase
MPSFDEVVMSVGFLNDKQIIAALAEEYLIERGTADLTQVRHASYTLRLGERAELCGALGASHQKKRSFEVRNLDANQPLELQPGDTALLYSMENLRLPPNVMGFTVARGLLFAEALTPENTYVDPGFSGTLYTTVTNVSGRVIRLNYQMPIVRLFFYKMSEPAARPYRSGPALKIAQQLETIPVSELGSDGLFAKAKKTELIDAIKRLPLAGAPISELFDRTDLNLLRLYLWSFLWPILLLLANTNSWLRDHLGSFVGNVVASIVAAILVYLGPTIYRRISR